MDTKDKLSAMRTIYQTARYEKNQDSTRDLISIAHTESPSTSIQVSRIEHHFKEECYKESVGPATFSVATFLEGSGEVAIERGEPMPIKPNTTILFQTPAETSGWYRWDANTNLLCLDLRFSFDLLNEYNVASLNILSPIFENDCSLHDRIMLSHTTTPEVRHITTQILNCPLRDNARKLYLQAKALEILAIIIGSCKTESAPFTSRREQRAIQRAIRVLNQYYEQPWTIASLAQEVGVNQTKLKSGFRHHIQTTIQSYLEEVRLNTACELLRAGKSITDTSLSVGFSNPSYFAKRFKLKYQLTPREWTHING